MASYLALALSVLVTACRADIILGGHDWDPNPGPGGWTSDQGWISVATPASGGHTGGWLQVTFPTTVEPEAGQAEWYGLVSTPATNLFAGTWDPSQWVQFDFWASNQVAGQVQVQWQSSTNSEVWRYTVTTGPTQMWTTVAAGLGNWADWQYPGATLDQYLADLATIDWIGVYIHRNGPDEQIYGIDDFDLMVPEPAEIFLLSMALATSAWCVRRRRKTDGRFSQRGG